MTLGGPAAVLERSMLGKKTQLDPRLAAKMGRGGLGLGSLERWPWLAASERGRSHRGCGNTVQLANVAAPHIHGRDASAR
jgi:hypothetical protein